VDETDVKVCPSLLGQAVSLCSFTGQVSSRNKGPDSAVMEQKCWVTLALEGFFHLLHEMVAG